MLSIYYGDLDDVILVPDVYFDNQYEDWWLTTDWSKQVILDVDKTVVVSPRLMDSKALGPIPPTDLSGGVKTLMLVNYDRSHVFNASACGDNCAKHFVELGRTEDILINLRHLMTFDLPRFDIRVANTEKIVHTDGELWREARQFIYGGVNYDR